MADAQPKTSGAAKPWSLGAFAEGRHRSRIAERCLKAVKDNRAALLAKIRDRSAALETLSDLVDKVTAEVHDDDAEMGGASSGGACCGGSGHESHDHDGGAPDDDHDLPPDFRLELLLELERTLYNELSFCSADDVPAEVAEAAAAAAAEEEAYLQELVQHFEAEHAEEGHSTTTSGGGNSSSKAARSDPFEDFDEQGDIAMGPSSSSGPAWVRTDILCPLCRGGSLRTDAPGLLLACRHCDLLMDTAGGFEVAQFQEELASRYSEHRHRCKSEPVFFVSNFDSPADLPPTPPLGAPRPPPPRGTRFKAGGSQVLFMSCATCDALEVVI